jgi:hypothetical protein
MMQERTSIIETKKKYFFKSYESTASNKSPTKKTETDQEIEP